MNLPLRITICFLLTSYVFSFEDADYVPVGCFNDRLSARALPELLENFRVQNSKWPEVMNWTHIETSVIKKCAAKAKSKGYLFFGIQFFGECWSGLRSHQTFAKYGPSSRCTKTAPLIGMQRSNYVYMLTKENECNRYKIFNSPDRSQFHNTDFTMRVRCDHDQIDENSWYRFAGAAGNAMAEKCVQPARCQTYRTGWFAGSYPKVADGIQGGNVCFSWNGNCCDNEVSVKIRNCGNFFVYKLSGNIGCMNGYCGNGKVIKT